jgi:hypothetical protein
VIGEAYEVTPPEQPPLPRAYIAWKHKPCEIMGGDPSHDPCTSGLFAGAGSLKPGVVVHGEKFRTIKVRETVLETETTSVVIQDFPSQPLLRLVDVTDRSTRNLTQFIVEKQFMARGGFEPFYCSRDVLPQPVGQKEGDKTHLAFLGTISEEGGTYRRWSVTPLDEEGELGKMSIEYWESNDEDRTPRRMFVQGKQTLEPGVDTFVHLIAPLKFDSYEGGLDAAQIEAWLQNHLGVLSVDELACSAAPEGSPAMPRHPTMKQFLGPYSEAGAKMVGKQLVLLSDSDLELVLHAFEWPVSYLSYWHSVIRDIRAQPEASNSNTDSVSGRRLAAWGSRPIPMPPSGVSPRSLGSAVNRSLQHLNQNDEKADCNLFEPMGLAMYQANLCGALCTKLPTDPLGVTMTSCVKVDEEPGWCAKFSAESTPSKPHWQKSTGATLTIEGNIDNVGDCKKPLKGYIKLKLTRGYCWDFWFWGDHMISFGISGALQFSIEEIDLYDGPALSPYVYAGSQIDWENDMRVARWYPEEGGRDCLHPPCYPKHQIKGRLPDYTTLPELYRLTDASLVEVRKSNPGYQQARQAGMGSRFKVSSGIELRAGLYDGWTSGSCTCEQCDPNEEAFKNNHWCGCRREAVRRRRNVGGGLVPTIGGEAKLSFAIALSPMCADCRSNLEASISASIKVSWWGFSLEWTLLDDYELFSIPNVLNPHTFSGCVPYTMFACRKAAEYWYVHKKKKFKEGCTDCTQTLRFADPSHTIAGCHYYDSGDYDGSIFYGASHIDPSPGSWSSISLPAKRPLGYDCCVPYSAKACEEAAKLAGKEMGGRGYAFEGWYGTKGCYTYADGPYKNHVYYGLGGGDADDTEPSTLQSRYGTLYSPIDITPKVRPRGWDCNADFPNFAFYHMNPL